MQVSFFCQTTKFTKKKKTEERGKNRLQYFFSLKNYVAYSY